MDEQARKRKAEEMEDSDVEGVEKEIPKQGLKTPKKQKTETKQPNSTLKPDTVANPADGDDNLKSTKAEAKKLKLQQKKEKAAKKLEKAKAKKERAAAQKVNLDEDEDEIHVEGLGDSDKDEVDVASNEEDTTADKLEKIEVDGIVDEEDAQQSTASPSPEVHSPTFDSPIEATAESATTSTSSVIPPAKAPKHIKMPTDPELLRSRLAARIEALRAQRKADGPNGQPARNRQELMEARRKKEEQRRAHKKELRMKAKIEEDARREEALASARDSPASSMMSPALHTADNHNFSFGRVAFADGQTLSADLSSLHDAPKRKGPQDPATALQASEKKRLRLAGLDDTKRADIEEKDMWLHAKQRAHGEKVRDDTSLLKKTLKRKEKAKKKSEKEWTERKEGVAKSQSMKQKKREENLRKRKEEKGPKKGGKGKSVKSKKTKPKSRPGFEGSFASGGKRR